MAHRIGKIQKTQVSSTEIVVNNGGTGVFYDTVGGAASVLGYDGQGLHHTVYVHDVATSVTLEVSTNTTDWAPVGVASAEGLLSTGDLNDPAPRYTRVKGAGDGNKYTVVSFSSLIPSP